MLAIEILPVAGAGDDPVPPLDLLDRCSAELARVFQVSCHVRTEPFDAAFALDPFRLQHHSSAILARMAEQAENDGTILLGIASADLFVPVLTFVFGEAQLRGNCALVSLHRLREDYYGMPPDETTLLTRLVKEALHEIGHTQGLRHCPDWRCVMSSSHAVERLDLKEIAYCPACRQAFG